MRLYTGQCFNASRGAIQNMSSFFVHLQLLHKFRFEFQNTSAPIYFSPLNYVWKKKSINNLIKISYAQALFSSFLPDSMAHKVLLLSWLNQNRVKCDYHDPLDKYLPQIPINDNLLIGITVLRE